MYLCNPAAYFKKVKGNQLTEEFKDLYIALISYSSDQRPSLKEIAAHPWMQKGFDKTGINKKIKELFVERKLTCATMTSSNASSIGNHEFTLVVLKEIIWRFSIMNLTRRFIPEPLLSFIVSYLMFKEEISSWPVSSPVFSIGGEDEVII